MAITVGIPRETFPGERRVALVPRTCDILQKAGMSVLLEESAGVQAGYLDAQYASRGARIAARAQVFQDADVLLQVRCLGSNREAGRADLPLFHRGQALIGFGDPLSSPRECADLAAAGVTYFSMELMPRITRAQNMDALSSMATIAGYRAALLAATTLGKMFPMLMTAAGTITPAKVFILGAGVAGLQAAATARRLGAVVSAYDVRAAVKEQVESVGAKFVNLEVNAGAAEDKGGYAKAMDEAFYRRQQELLTGVLREQDVAITTAAVPGRKAPLLITAEMAGAMMPGSLIIDIAAERGGNCELTKPGELVVTPGGVSILGPLNLPSSVPFHASQMYSSNIATFLRHLIKDGALTADLEDEIVRDTLITRDGRIVHPRVLEIADAALAAAPGVRSDTQ